MWPSSKSLITGLALWLASGLALANNPPDRRVTVQEWVEGKTITHELTVPEAFELAKELEGRRAYTRTIPFYAAILEVEPDNLEAHNRLGFDYYMMQLYDEAIRELEWVLGRDPTNAPAHFLMGNILRDYRGDYSAALKHYELAAQHTEGDLRATALEPAGDIYQLQLYDWDRAIQRYHEVLKVWPNHPKTHFNLGACLANQRKFDEAITEFERVIGLPQDPEHPELAGRAREAIATIRKTQGR